MRGIHLAVICALGILAGSASAQQRNYGPRNFIPVFDAGGGYRLSTMSPYYRPGYAASPFYYTPAVSPAYYGRGFPPPGFTPAAVTYNGAYLGNAPLYYNGNYPLNTTYSTGSYFPGGVYYFSGYRQP